MSGRNVAVGFLYHAETRKVLLHLRDEDVPVNPGKWAHVGGGTEPQDGGDPVATWCREVREEVGVRLDAARVVPLRDGTTDEDARWHVFYYEWPSLDTEFRLGEGQALGWFTLEEAFALPNLAATAGSDLECLGERVDL